MEICCRYFELLNGCVVVEEFDPDEVTVVVDENPWPAVVVGAIVVTGLVMLVIGTVLVVPFMTLERFPDCWPFFPVAAWLCGSKSMNAAMQSSIAAISPTIIF